MSMERLDQLVEALQNGDGGAFIGELSTGESCYVALSADRYDLLPANYDDPIEAWRRLEPELRQGVCCWRGWPREWASG